MKPLFFVLCKSELSLVPGVSMVNASACLVDAWSMFRFCKKGLPDLRLRVKTMVVEYTRGKHISLVKFNDIFKQVLST